MSTEPIDLTLKIRHPEWFVDNLLGSLIKPSNCVVVTGFWRSGTTWLLQSMAESLNAKSVFEPFHPSIKLYRDATGRNFDDIPLTSDFLHLYMPYVSLYDRGENSQLRNYVRQSFLSCVPGNWIRRSRANEYSGGGVLRDNKISRVLHRLSHAFRTKVVVKFVRGHLMVPALLDWFDPLIIHVWRDPRAILPSFERSFSDWWHHLSLEKHLLGVHDGRKDYFAAYADKIVEYDTKDRVARLAAYWSLTEKFIRDVESKSRLVRVSYEKVCTDGPSYIERKIREETGIHYPLDMAGNSATTFGKRRDANLNKRLYGWKKELGEKKIAKIERTVEAFGMSNLLR